MYIYFIATLLLAVFCIIERKYYRYKCFYISFSIVSFLLIFRFGQGSDFWGYKYVWEQEKYYISIVGEKELFKSLLYTIREVPLGVGIRILFLVSIFIGLSYCIVIMLIAVFDSVLVYRYIFRYCAYKSLAIFMLWHTFYLTYMFSGLKQSIAMALFIGVMLPLYEEQNWWLYYIINVVAMIFHPVALVYIIFPLIRNIKANRTFYVVIGLAWTCGLVVSLGFFNRVIESIVPQRFQYYIQDIGLKPSQLITRGLVLCVVLLLWNKCKKLKILLPQIVEKLFVFYMIGIALFGALSFLSYPAARMFQCFQVLEPAIITSLLWKVDENVVNSKDVAIINAGKVKQFIRFNVAIFILLMIFCTAMYFKNIKDYIYRQSYNSNITILNYPYVSVFNKRDINLYRNLEEYDSDLVFDLFY